MRSRLRDLLGSMFDPVFPSSAARSIAFVAFGIALTTESLRAETIARPFAAPSFTTTSITSYERRQKPAECTSPECAQRKLTAEATVRLRGEFGKFTGSVTSWGPDSLAGFRPDFDWNDPAPAGSVGWTQVERVDRRVSNAGRGAVIGGVIGSMLGALIAAVGASAAPTTVFGSSNQDYTAESIACVAAGGLLGAITGAAIGSTSSRWVLVYQRPLGSADAPR